MAEIGPCLAKYAAAATFGNNAIATEWQRADKAVEANLAKPGRSWTWGKSIQITIEPYLESVNQKRLVQYFDKGRLEEISPLSQTTTSGLLVKEMIAGKIQTGNNQFHAKPTPDIALAGDMSSNNPSPTYLTLGKIASLNNDNSVSDETGQTLNQIIDREAKISTTNSPPAIVKLVEYEPNLKHNLPDVFWDFMNQRGTIWQAGEYTNNQPVFDWQKVVGLPITEAYWTTALVNGTRHNVLLQAFERRILTYTPDNPDSFKVEMANVGQHYYQWRYDGLSASPPNDIVSPTVLPSSSILANFPIYSQQHNLSCEYAATRMMTAYAGQEIGEAELISQIQFNPNPHLGFRGDIDGPFGGTNDYGIYPEPIAKMLEQHGFKTKLLAGGVESIKQEIVLGRSVQVWIVAGFGYGNPFTTSYQDLSFKLTAGEHSVVVYGYDATSLYIADPAYGQRYKVDYPTFMRNWTYFDQMAISIWSDQIFQPAGPNWGVSPYFYQFWLSSNNQKLFGLPIAAPETKGTKITQYFERARLEYDLTAPFNQTIGLGRLGLELTTNRLKEKPFLPVQTMPEDPNVVFFEATKHTLGSGFKSYWQQQGGLAIFGYPISEEFLENGLVVQYFERARLEYHPEQPEGSKVTLGQVGVERLSAKN